MHTSIVKHVVYPVRDLVDGLKGYNSMKYYGELMKSQWFTPDLLEDLQRKKLRALLEHAYTNVPYYHKMFKDLGLKPSDINSMGDLSKLPVITKSDIIENFSDVNPKNTARVSDRGNRAISAKPFRSISDLIAKYLANMYKSMRITFKPKNNLSPLVLKYPLGS